MSYLIESYGPLERKTAARWGPPLSEYVLLSRQGLRELGYVEGQNLVIAIFPLA